jgi:hypothetical protein
MEFETRARLAWDGVWDRQLKATAPLLPAHAVHAAPINPKSGTYCDLDRTGRANEYVGGDRNALRSRSVVSADGILMRLQSKDAQQGGRMLESGRCT